jgi:hypothetical protein
MAARVTDAAAAAGVNRVTCCCTAKSSFGTCGFVSALAGAGGTQSSQPPGGFQLPGTDGF